MPANAVLDGLCPVVLLNAEYDDLRSSSEAFAAQLAVAGVDVRQVLFRGLLHGFLNMPATIEPVGPGTGSDGRNRGRYRHSIDSAGASA